jgi:lactate 2-monooxygenase
MMVSPPERDLSITLFDKHFDSPIFMCPIGLIGLCAPDFQGDVAAAQSSAATGVPFTLSTFSQAPMEHVIKHAGTMPNFFQLYLPGDRELATRFINRAETSGYSALMLTVDSWALGHRPSDLQLGNFPQFRGFCMENYYSDENFTKHLAKAAPPGSGRRIAALREDLRAPVVVGRPPLDSVADQIADRGEGHSAPR